ncbi:flavodoxin family protein [Nocardioides pacificus]
MEVDTMRALVIFESMWGNSERVARAISEGLAEGLAGGPAGESAGESAGASGAVELVEVELLEVGAAPATLPEDLDLLVVGGPTHAFSLSRHSTRADALGKGATRPSAEPGLRDWLEGLGYGPHRAVVATFDTRVAQVKHLPGSAARKAMKMLRERGFDAVAHPKSFFVADMAGPLLDGEIEQARAWARDLGARQLVRQH